MKSIEYRRPGSAGRHYDEESGNIFRCRPKPDGEIEVDIQEYKGVLPWKAPRKKIPFIRGIFNFVDFLVLGMKTLTYSASFFEDEEEEILTEDEARKQEKKEKN